MPTDNQYDEILDKLADDHQRRLLNALTDLENQVADLMGDAPLRDGQLFDLEWAVQARPQLREALDDAYLSQVNGVVGDYAALADEAQDMLSTYGDFTKLDSSVIQQLQRLSFQGFEGVANEYLDVLANEVYQSTLVGRSFNDTVKNLRQTINGVYIQSDDVEAQRLVDIVNNGTVAQANAAAEQLRTKFARDRAGNNLRRYASQMAQDSLMQFDASINTRIGIESGATKWKYYGDVIRDSRPFCRKHAGKVYTTEEIEEIWAGSWQGKAAGDPFIVRGGYNCRHHWRPIFDTEDIPEEQEAAEPIFKMADDVNVDGNRSDLNIAMNAMNPQVLAVANKLKQPRTVSVPSNPDKAFYRRQDRVIVTDYKHRGGSVVRHEYGHHMDYELNELLGNGMPYTAFSEIDAGFKKAFAEDKKRNKLMPKDRKNPIINIENNRKFRNEIFEDVTFTRGGQTFIKRELKDPELGNFSDIWDAMSDGEFYRDYGGFGHGTTYYKRKGFKEQETFANLTALRGTEQWSKVEEYFPSLAKRYDEIMEEALAV